jgi:hypothetical protein
MVLAVTTAGEEFETGTERVYDSSVSGPSDSDESLTHTSTVERVVEPCGGAGGTGRIMKRSSPSSNVGNGPTSSQQVLFFRAYFLVFE